MSAVAIIPARSGSRRIPGKNIRQFHGNPIIAYPIQAALDSGLFERVIVSSEDAQIGAIAQDYGAQWLPRDPALAEVGGAPDPGTQEVTRQVLLGLPKLPDYACCIYPCAPMLEARDLRIGMNLLSEWPYVYVDGWYYFGKTQAFIDGVPLTEGIRAMPPMPIGRWIDINTEDDWLKAERMYSKLRKATA